MTFASSRPEDLGGLSEQVYDALARYTAFPWPVLKTQCERVKADPYRLTAAALDGPLLDYLATSVARFTSPEKGRLLREELLVLVQQPSRRGPRSVRP